MLYGHLQRIDSIYKRSMQDKSTVSVIELVKLRFLSMCDLLLRGITLPKTGRLGCLVYGCYLCQLPTLDSIYQPVSGLM